MFLVLVTLQVQGTEILILLIVLKINVKFDIRNNFL